MNLAIDKAHDGTYYVFDTDNPGPNDIVAEGFATHADAVTWRNDRWPRLEVEYDPLEGSYYVHNPTTGIIFCEGFEYEEEAAQYRDTMNKIREIEIRPREVVTVDESDYEQKFYEDPDTGAKKEIKTAQLGAIDPKALLLLAEAAGYGAGKYEQYNYLKGYPWSLSFNAMMRHALAFWNGEDIDPESGLPHMVHAAWHGLAMTSFLTREIGEDDRFHGSKGE